MQLATIRLCLLALLASTTLQGRAQETLPADVDPGSRSRLPPSGPGAPGGVAAIVAHGSGALVRWEFALGRRLSELAILTVARELDQPYEWSLHELEAVAVGLAPSVIDVVKRRLPLTGLGETEAAIIQVGRELIGRHRLSPETYARAESRLGTTNLVDIVMLMAEYVEDGVRLTAFNQQMPPGWPQFLPLPFSPPDDIHADSRSRLPYLRRETRRASATPSLYGRGLAPEGTGPGQIMRRARGPAALEASLGGRAVRLARLVAARELGDEYQWTLNAVAARGDGLEPAVVELVRDRAPTTQLAAEQAALIELGRELIGEHRVGASTYARALAQFGEQDLVDLVNVFAKVAGDAALLIAFDQQLPAGQAPLLHAQSDGAASARDALAPTGTLRAVFLATNPMQGTVDPDTREVSGIAADIARALGERIGAPVSIEPVHGVPAVIEAVGNGAADIGFLAYDETRARRVAFAQTYVLGHNSYAVRADSPIRTLEQADRAGVRIGAREGVSVDLHLVRTLERAERVPLPRATTDEAAIDRLLAGELDAYAANTQRLAAVAATEPRIRVVDGSLMSAKQSIAVPLNNTAGVAALNRFLDDARTSGLLQRIVDRYRLAGVEVAPAGAR